MAIFEATQLSCELMAHALEASSDNIKVVWTAVSADAESQLVNSASVVLISSTLQEGQFSGFALLRRLSKTDRALNCVMLLDHDQRELVIEAFRSGAVGVCYRDQPYDQLCKSIVCVHGGQVWANSHQMRYLLEALWSGLPHFIADGNAQIPLSKREQEVVCRVAEGMKNREIAELLQVSEHTVKNHLFRIFDRLGVSSRAELILYLQAQKQSALADKKSA